MTPLDQKVRRHQGVQPLALRQHGAIVADAHNTGWSHVASSADITAASADNTGASRIFNIGTTRAATMTGGVLELGGYAPDEFEFSKM